MKRMIPLLLVCLILAGCTAKLVPLQEDGSAWDDSFLTIGTEMGIALPAEGPVLYEYNDVQGLDGIYYASFSWGEARKILNDEGKEADLFPAQLYLLTRECVEDEAARSAIEQWKAVGENAYVLTELEPAGDYRLYALEPRNDSPFVSGVLGLGVHNGIAVSIQLMCSEECFDDLREPAAAFLAALRFRAMEG